MKRSRWTVVAAGGAVAAAGLGGFAIVNAQPDRPQVHGVELRRTEIAASPVDGPLGSPSSVTVTTAPSVTTVPVPVAPVPVAPPPTGGALGSSDVASVASVASPDVATSAPPAAPVAPAAPPAPDDDSPDSPDVEAPASADSPDDSD